MQPWNCGSGAVFERKIGGSGTEKQRSPTKRPEEKLNAKQAVFPLREKGAWRGEAEQENSEAPRSGTGIGEKSDTYTIKE